MTQEIDEKRPQFGNRFLTDPDDVFKHNAWDNVAWDEEQEEQANQMVAANSTIKLTDEEISKIEESASTNWDKFYGIHQNRFFKDRNWLFTEFLELADPTTSAVLELGCGVGNTVFPILEYNNDPKLTVYCCDFSSQAVDLVKANPVYVSGRCNAFVCDISKQDWSSNVPFGESSLDCVILLFVLSALDPDTMPNVVSNIKKYLKPGGQVFFRDYGRFDMAQLRFKAGKCLKDNFYVRGDGTRCYFFSEPDVSNLFVSRFGFEQIQLLSDRRLQVNRGKKLKMYRVWIQGKFRKPVQDS